MTKTNSTKTNKNKKKKDSMIDDVVEIEMEFFCPKRGKIKQKVKVKKLKPIVPNIKHVMNTSSREDIIDSEEELPLYDEMEE